MDGSQSWAWFSGGRHQYMTLVDCMNRDWFWIGLTVALDLIVASGYVVIALHWRKNEATLPPSPSRAALGQMKKIFVFCGICGYVFIPIKMFWPAWRLYDGFVAVLAYYTWRYAAGARDLAVVYKQLERTAKLEEDLEESRREGRRKSEFLNAISHDLKTPLNGMMLQAELAEMMLAADDPEALREALAEIKTCARTGADLLNRLLELGRLDWSEEPSRMHPLDLGELLEDVTGQLRPRAEQQGLAVVNECPRGIEVTTDRGKLQRILFHLVDNAIKFTPQGTVRLHAEADRRRVSIHVEDTGVGIAAEDHERIFDDFSQVNNRERDSRKGFGLGLAIARRLVRQVGGELAVASGAGRGSRFTLSLPRAAPPRKNNEA